MLGPFLTKLVIFDRDSLLVFVHTATESVFAILDISIETLIFEVNLKLQCIMWYPTR